MLFPLTGPAAQPAPVTKPVPVAGSVFDDFDGPAGSAPNAALWTPVTGVQWGSGTSDAGNVTLDGQSNLALTATQNGPAWSVGEVATWNRQLGYGTFSASIQMPPGAGIHPSFWLLGQTYNPANTAGTWPQCGEIDIIELIDNGNYYCTIHGPMYNADNGYTQSQINGPLDFNPTTGFHTYWCEHLPESVTFGIDGTTVGTITPADLPAGAPWELDQPFSALLSVAVGSSSVWGGAPNTSTPGTVAMLVDWFYWEPSSS